MLKAMFLNRIPSYKSLVGTFFALVFSVGFSAAAPPTDVDSQGFPQYVQSEFELVKDMLDALSTQLGDMETNLKAEIALAKDEINTNMDLLAQDMDEALAILNAPDKDIQVSTEICFNLGASMDYALVGKVVGGLGWDAGLKGELALEFTGPAMLPVVPTVPPITVPIPAVGAGVSDTICVTVPLYAVASNDHWIQDFDTTEFDALLAGIAQPVQFLLPALAHAYGQVMPTVEGAIGSLTGSLNVFDPNQPIAGKGVLLADQQVVDEAALVTASESYESMVQDSPLLGHIMETDSFADAISDPCGFAAGLGLPGTDAVLGGCQAGASAVDLFLDLLDPACILDPFHIAHCQ